MCQAGDAKRKGKRKGKCERPFRDLKETFLVECDALGAPGSVAELNRRAGRFVDRRVHARVHSTTGVAPAERVEVERRFLGSLPRRRFDTAYVEDRRVHPKLPLLEWGGVSYSVPPECLGHKVTCRVEVDSTTLEVSLGATVVARHELSPGTSGPVWEPGHRQAAEAIALGRGRPALRVVPPPADEDPPAGGRLELGDGDYDIDAVDLVARYGACGCTGQGS
jgi:hypothetical protein